MTRVLVVAKAPVPGQAKTRLAAAVGDDTAADLAAACFLDSLAAARSFAGRSGVVVALTGDLDHAARADNLRDALADVTVVPQRGDGFAARLVLAHADAGDGPVLQIGMDTPQITADLLAAAAETLARYDAVLGPAADGGWWGLGRHLAAHARPLAAVPMSSASTYVETCAALLATGLRVAETTVLRDLDEVEDAGPIAEAAPGSRFATAWHALRRVTT